MKPTGRFEGYSLTAFRKDLVSGLIVGVIAIPLGMAFAMASGVKPEYGIYTTIVAGILISLLGGSKFQIGGPTGAYIPVLLAIVLEYGYENLLIAGFLAGGFLIVMGICRFGTLIRFIPKPVTVGFTAGIAVIIFSGQIAHFLGLRNIERHEDFISNMKEIADHLSTLNGYSILTACICLAIILFVSRYMPKIPGSLLGLVVSSAAAALLYNGQVATIASTFGAIPGGLPHLEWPSITWERIETMLLPAVIIAMLGGVESLLSAVVADEMTGTRHNSNRELIGQGIANMVTPLFGGIPATGAIARTATNIKNGAVSPISGIIHGVTVLLVLLLLAPYASLLPLASMAPILMLVAWNMSERKEFLRILKTKSSDSFILLVTFVLTVFTTLTTAVAAGLILAVVWFVKRMGDLNAVSRILPDASVKHGMIQAHLDQDGRDGAPMSIFTIEGPLFFGTAIPLEEQIPGHGQDRSSIVLLQLGKVPYIDTTGAAHLDRLVRHFTKSGGTVLLSEIGQQPLSVLERTGLIERVGREHVFGHTEEAVAFALGRPGRTAGASHFMKVPVINR